MNTVTTNLVNADWTFLTLVNGACPFFGPHTVHQTVGTTSGDMSNRRMPVAALQAAFFSFNRSQRRFSTKNGNGGRSQNDRIAGDVPVNNDDIEMPEGDTAGGRRLPVRRAGFLRSGRCAAGARDLHRRRSTVEDC
jgi:hypothetical protein